MTPARICDSCEPRGASFTDGHSEELVAIDRRRLIGNSKSILLQTLTRAASAWAGSNPLNPLHRRWFR